MTTNTELIARLRLGASISRERKLNQGYDAVADEAADAIEALEAEVLRLQHEVVNRNQRALDGDLAVKVRDEEFARNEQLMAQLAAAQAQEPVGFVESAVRGAGGFHACLSSGVFVPAGTQLYTAPIPQQAQEPSDFATIAGLEASVSHLSSIVDEQLRLLIDVEKECGTDGHGGEFEDGESVIIDRVRAHIACYVAPQPKDMK